MSSFYLPLSSRAWFRHIQGGKDSGFYLDFDIYYFCLLAGLTRSKKDPELSKKEVIEIIRHFPDEYVPNKHFIVAFFLKTELELLGIQLSEKKALDRELSRLLDPNSVTTLSEIGMAELNNYAFGGFGELQKCFPEPPRTLDSFLIAYYRFLDK